MKNSISNTTAILQDTHYSHFTDGGNWDLERLSNSAQIYRVNNWQKGGLNPRMSGTNTTLTVSTRFCCLQTVGKTWLQYGFAIILKVFLGVPFKHFGSWFPSLWKKGVTIRSSGLSSKSNIHGRHLHVLDYKNWIRAVQREKERKLSSGG